MMCVCLHAHLPVYYHTPQTLETNSGTMYYSKTNNFIFYLFSSTQFTLVRIIPLYLKWIMAHEYIFLVSKSSSNFCSLRSPHKIHHKEHHAHSKEKHILEWKHHLFCHRSLSKTQSATRIHFQHAVKENEKLLQPLDILNITHTYLLSRLTNDSNSYHKYHKQETILAKRQHLK